MSIKPKKQTKKQKLEALATRELPPNLQSKLQSVRNAIDDLKAEAETKGVYREFSPDGRFLGDIGELIAKIFYGVTLTVKQQKGHDATEAEVDGEANAQSGRKVEVKLRSRSTNIEFSTKQEMILVIYVSPKTLLWGEVCNGPGEKLLNTANEKNGRFFTDCHKLMEAQQNVAEEERLKYGSIEKT